MPRHILALVATLAGLLAAIPAAACSSSSDYVAPSNFELVRMADAIGIYTAVSGRSGPDYIFGNVTFRREQAVKGTPPAEVTLDLAVLSATADPPEPDEIERAFESMDYGGGCSRIGFVRGGRVLLILRRGANGDWYPVPEGGSRAKEDYGGENAPWARTVRRYVALQSLRPAAQLAALTAMRDSGRDRGGAALLPAERADIAHHLRAPSQWKPTAWLLARYAQAARGEAVDIVLDGPAQRSLGADRARLALLASLANGHHPAAQPLFDRLGGSPGSGGWDLALMLRYLAGHGQYSRAYRWIETRLAGRLLTLAPDEARVLLREVADVQRGGGEYGHERWRADPHAAATWPEVALGLHWYEVGRLPDGDRQIFAEAIREIPVGDYRARPLLSVALAATLEARALAWAAAELARLPAPAGEQEDEWRRDERDELASLPARMLVANWRRESEPSLILAFCQGGARRMTIVDALRQWGDPSYHELLGRMAAFPGLTARERARLLQAALEISVRNIDGPDHASNLGDADSPWLLTRLIRGQPSRGAPLSCPG